MWSVTGRLILRFFGLFLGQRTWNSLFLWLLGQAPRIWGGKYTAYEHGRRSRDWLYKQWVEEKTKAAGSPSLWDDNGCAWIRGFQMFNVESDMVAGQIREALQDLSNDTPVTAQHRLAGVLKSLTGNPEGQA